MVTQKELEAGVMVLSTLVISGWVAWDVSSNGVPVDVSAAAWKMIWAVGYSVLFNIIAVIIAHIVAAIITGGQEISDERADERDRLINGKAMRNGYFVLSIGVLGVLIWQALGLEAALGPYALFGISMLAGGTFAASQLLYYRIN